MLLYDDDYKLTGHNANVRQISQAGRSMIVVKNTIWSSRPDAQLPVEIE
jgi:hypothetical protein